MSAPQPGPTVTPADQLDVPQIDSLLFGDRESLTAAQRDLAGEHWIVRSLLGYSILQHGDVVAVLRDKRWHNASGKILELSGITDPEALGRRRTSILSAEGDEHTRLRRLVARAFTPRAADRLRPFMRDVVNRLVDPVAGAGCTDLAVDVCEPYPIPIICELLGAPSEHWQLFSRWAADILAIFNGNLAEDLPMIMAAQDELDAYTMAMIERRRTMPADDLLTELIAAEEQGDRLSNEELVQMVEAVIIGGTDTTRNQLGLAVAVFAAHPDQWRLLAEQPELAPAAVEETMRVSGAVGATGRIASEDIVYRDVLFPAGTFVSPSLSAANFDPSVFDDAATFDITRAAPSQGHLSFGAGIHYCLGANLARAELQEALPILARRMPDLELDGPPVWKPSQVGIFGAQHLPIRFTPTD